MCMEHMITVALTKNTYQSILLPVPEEVSKGFHKQHCELFVNE